MKIHKLCTRSPLTSTTQIDGFHIKTESCKIKNTKNFCKLAENKPEETWRYWLWGKIETREGALSHPHKRKEVQTNVMRTKESFVTFSPKTLPFILSSCHLTLDNMESTHQLIYITQLSTPTKNVSPIIIIIIIK